MEIETIFFKEDPFGENYGHSDEITSENAKVLREYFYDACKILVFRVRRGLLTEDEEGKFGHSTEGNIKQALITSYIMCSKYEMESVLDDVDNNFTKLFEVMREEIAKYYEDTWLTSADLCQEIWKSI